MKEKTIITKLPKILDVIDIEEGKKLLESDEYVVIFIHQDDIEVECCKQDRKSGK